MSCLSTGLEGSQPDHRAVRVQQTFVVEDTYWFAINDPKAPLPSELGVRHTRAAGGADPGFRDAERGDFSLSEGSSARGHGVREEQGTAQAPK